MNEKMNDSPQKPLFNAELFQRQKLDNLESHTRSLFSRLEYWIDSIAYDAMPQLTPVTIARDEVHKYLNLFLDALRSGLSAFKHCDNGIEIALKISPKTKKEEWHAYIEEMHKVALLVTAESDLGLELLLQFKVSLEDSIVSLRSENKDYHLGDDLVRDHALYVLRWLRQSLDRYLAYWTEVKIHSEHLCDNIVMLGRFHGLLRHKGTISGWDTLRSRFAYYIIKVQRLNDQYPMLFSFMGNVDIDGRSYCSIATATTLTYTTALTSQHRSNTTSIYSFTPIDTDNRTLKRKKQFSNDFSLTESQGDRYSQYSYASSRTTSTDYGIYYIRWKDSPIVREEEDAEDGLM